MEILSKDEMQKKDWFAQLISEFNTYGEERIVKLTQQVPPKNRMDQYLFPLGHYRLY